MGKLNWDGVTIVDADGASHKNVRPGELKKPFRDVSYSNSEGRKALPEKPVDHLHRKLLGYDVFITVRIEPNAEETQALKFVTKYKNSPDFITYVNRDNFETVSFWNN